MTSPQLARLTLSYLALPQLFFLPFWFRPWLGGFATLALVAGVIGAWRVLRTTPREATEIGSRSVYGALVVAAAMTCLSGASGLLHQTWDWEKHNAVLLDLTRYHWPVVYELPGPDRYHLMYYLAYYLPAAAVGKAGGAIAGQAALAIWTFAGTWLALLWIVALVGQRPLLTLLVFPLLSGMDILGHRILQGAFPSWFQNVEGWLRGHAYWANLVLHVWSPQHALTAWLGTPLVLYGASSPRLVGIGLLGCSLLLFWSSLVFLAVVVVFAWALFAYRARLRELFTPVREPAVAACILAAAAVLFSGWIFLSNGASPIPVAWLGEREPLREFLPKLLLFYLIEFGAFALLLPAKKLLSVRDRQWLLLALALLLLAPWIYFGLFNDLMVRVAHVAQYLFWIALLSALWRATAHPASGWRRAGPLLACLAVGAITPLLQLRFIWRATALNPDPVRPATPVPNLQPAAIAAQYLGRLDSWKAGALDLAQTTAAVVPPLPGHPAFAFRAPLLLFNFRGQGIEYDASGWQMWNRGPLEFAFSVRDQALVHSAVPVRIHFQLTAWDRPRAIALRLQGSSATGENNFHAEPGKWTEVTLEPLTVTKPELTLTFTSPDPITGDANDPQRREFAVKNVRFELPGLRAR